MKSIELIFSDRAVGAQRLVDLYRLTPPYHAHTKAEELYLVLEGRPTLLADGVESGLGPGAAAHFPVEQPHALANRSDDPVYLPAIWLSY